MRISSGLLLFLAGFSMFVALGSLFVTVAGGDYRSELLTALGGMIVADACCAAVFLRGGRLRWVALAVALPTAFIVWDLLRRTLSAW
jgi:hypothetical protein